MLSPFLFVHAASLLRSSPLSAQGDSGRSFSDLLASVQSFVWGPPLIVLLVGTGLYLTLLLRGLQFRQLKHSLWLALVKRREEGAEGDISHFQALMTALAATVGTGNIVGVATAIAAGGPGALFWMWMTGLVGMATKYSEAVLGVRFRETDDRGEMSGGPMYYLKHGISGRLGRVLAFVFALFASVAAFGIGNGVQSQAVADALNRSFSIPHWLTGVVVATLVAVVIFGGIKSIGRFTGVFVPMMIVLYMAAAGLVIVLNLGGVPEAFRLVFTGAFTPMAVGGGALGYTVAQAVRFGVARGIFSNESGLGTGGIAAAAAQTAEPVRQAMVSMTQTFIDTIVVCSFTGIAILSTGAWSSGVDGANLTQLAFSSGLPGQFGGAIVAVCLSFFAFSTMLGWSYYGERNLEYLLGVKAIVPYRLLFVAVIAVSAVAKLDVVWLLSDIMNALMAFPNLIGLLLLSGIVWRETRSYFARHADGP
ncbi:MAG: sodium:alanine symporter family protein [Gemmatimonadetes bacterium]|nr:sodium:alanine symporter family protein [Gemmatimonadota bacterium]